MEYHYDGFSPFFYFLFIFGLINYLNNSGADFISQLNNQPPGERVDLFGPHIVFYFGGLWFYLLKLVNRSGCIDLNQGISMRPRLLACRLLTLLRMAQTVDVAEDVVATCNIVIMVTITIFCKKKEINEHVNDSNCFRYLSNFIKLYYTINNAILSIFFDSCIV